MKPHKEVNLIAGRSLLNLAGQGYIDFYIEHQEYLDKCLEVKLSKNKQIELSAKSDFMGVVKFSDYSLRVFPKFFREETLKLQSFDMFTAYFFERKNENRTHRVQTDVSPESGDSFYDYYFNLLLLDFLKVVKRLSRQIFVDEISEVFGVKGRIRFLDSIKSSGGLMHKHVCQTNEIQDDLFFLGLMKAYIRLIRSLVISESVQSLSNKCLACLGEVNEVPLSRDNLNAFNRQKETIIRKNLALKPVLTQVAEVLETLTNDVTPISHLGFSFNLAKTFELAVFEALKSGSSRHSLACHSGNNKPERFLNVTADFSMQNDQEVCKTLHIKPDVILADSLTGEVISILDTKYKQSLDQRGMPIVRSQDIYQMISYWLHYRRNNSRNPILLLLHPAEADNSTSEIVRVTGRGTFETGLEGASSVKIVTAEINFMSIARVKVKNGSLEDIGSSILQTLDLNTQSPTLKLATYS
ncbi:MAG: hypothetical protein R3A80_07595 [Bdellovibrionota bacterium]